MEELDCYWSRACCVSVNWMATNYYVVFTAICRDGKKMSKSLRNYPDPNIVINTYGADATRFVAF